jgi:putative SOS response-associated peptidase YedK
VPVVRRVEDGNDCNLLRWGLIPFFANGIPGKYHTINARIESMETSPAYRTPWRRAQRCIVPSNGFYEWQELTGGVKQPWFIHSVERELFGFAGLWDRSIGSDNVAIESFTIITMPAAPFMAEIHNTRRREPAILQPDDYEARATLRPAVAGTLSAHPVSQRVNSPRNHGAELIAALE